MPNLSPEKLLEKLAKGKPVGAIVLEGTDPYLRDMCRGKIIDSYVPEPMRDWALARISVRGGDWSELFQRAETMPMLAPCQVVLIDGAETIQGRAKGGDAGDADDDDGGSGDDPRKDTLKAFADYLEKPAPFTVLVFEVPSRSSPAPLQNPRGEGADRRIDARQRICRVTRRAIGERPRRGN